MNADLDFQPHGLANVDELDRFVVLVEQGDRFDPRLAGARAGLHPAILQALYLDGGVFPFGDDGVVEVHHLLWIAVLDDETVLQQDGAVA